MTESDPGTARRGFGGASQRASASTATTVPRKSGGGSTGGSSTGSSSERSGERGSNGRSTSVNGKSATDSGRTSTRTDQRGASRTAPAAKKSTSRKPRRARLRLSQVDAWSVMKTSFLLSIAMGIVTVVAVGIVWSVLGAAGVFDSLNDTVQTVMGNSFQIQDYIGTGRVLGFTMLVAVVDVVLLTAIATLGAFLYNLAATLLGGVELTLTEDG